MALKIALKPNEKIIIAGAVIINGSSGTHLLVENNVPLLREKDILEKKTPIHRLVRFILLFN